MKTIKLAPGERLVTNQLNRKGVLPQNIVDTARDIDDVLRQHALTVEIGRAHV